MALNPSIHATQGEPGKVHFSDAIGVLGMGLLLGSILTYFFIDEMQYSPSGAEGAFGVEGTWLRLVGLATFVLLLYVVPYFSHILQQRQRFVLILITGTALFLVLPLTTLGSLVVGDLPLVFALVAWVFMGVGATLLFSLWSQYLATLVGRSLVITVATSLCLSFLILLIGTCLPYGMASLVVAFFPFISGLLFFYLIRQSPIPDVPVVDESPIKISPLPFAAFAICLNGAPVGFALQHLMANGGAVDSRILIAASGLIGSAFFMGFSFPAKGRFVSFSLARRITFPVFIICLLGMLSTESEALRFWAVILVSAFFFTDSANWAFLAKLASSHRTQVVALILKGKRPLGLGLLLGWIMGMFVYTNPFSWVWLTDQSVVFLLIVLLALGATLVPFSRETLALDASFVEQDIMATEGGLWKRTALFTAHENKLTPREREVFLLLAKGRNASSIEKELVVSVSTAKSHIYHIYKKLGVASHQELLDLIESNRERYLVNTEDNQAK